MDYDWYMMVAVFLPQLNYFQDIFFVTDRFNTFIAKL